MDADDAAIDVKQRASGVSTHQGAIAHQKAAGVFLVDSSDAHRRCAPQVKATWMAHGHDHCRRLKLVRIAEFNKRIGACLVDFRQAQVTGVVGTEHGAFKRVAVGENHRHVFVAAGHMGSS